MTKEQKINTNIAAVELLGSDARDCEECVKGRRYFEFGSKNGIECSSCRGTTKLCFITNPAACLAVVKKLGEHCVDILSCSNNEFELTGWRFHDCKNDIESPEYATYEEAVGAACLEIQGERDE